MAPLPESSTKRVKYTYANAYHSHSITLRAVSTGSIADVDAIVSSLLTNIGIGCIASTITSVETALLGSNIFNPEPASTLVGTSFGSGSGDLSTDANGIGFVGRGSDGRRARIFLFGWKNGDSNFRQLPSENPNVATFVNVLNALPNALLTIGGTAPTWHLYANIKFNDHWVKRARA